MYWTDQALLEVARAIRGVVEHTLTGLEDGRLELASGSDLKSHHRVDDLLTQAIVSWWQVAQLPVRLFLEGEPPRDPAYGQACASLLIDPIDGSLNRDLGVGDPGFVLSVANTPSPRFRDICGGYVLGVRSGDSYHTQAGRLVFTPRERASRIVRCDSDVKTLQASILYYNDGYGPAFAHAALHRAGFLPLHVRHHNAFDNTALELAQICRGAAHLRVEARSYLRGDTRRGSDHANILPAFALGRAAGLYVGDLSGAPLDDIEVDMDRAQDFLVASSRELFSAAVDFLTDNIGACPLRSLCEARPEPQRNPFNVKL